MLRQTSKDEALSPRHFLVNAQALLSPLSTRVLSRLSNARRRPIKARPSKGRGSRSRRPAAPKGSRVSSPKAVILYVCRSSLEPSYTTLGANIFSRVGDLHFVRYGVASQDLYGQGPLGPGSAPPARELAVWWERELTEEKCRLKGHIKERPTWHPPCPQPPTH